MMAERDADFLNRLRAGILTDSPGATADAGARLAAQLPPGRVVAFEGDLGSGKTTFIGGMARAWGVDRPVTSPTFNLFTVYQGERRFVHLDAYRLNSADDMDALMLEDFLRPPWCLAVEWPSRIEEWLPGDALWIAMDIKSPGRHRVRLLGDSP